MEGQAIECGMLASPGAISDVAPEGDDWQIKVLNEHLKVVDGPTLWM